MSTREVLLVDAFTDEPMGGNPAGVVLDGDGLAADQMRAIANELGASETAFVRSADDADRRVRYFTPEAEVDLCGHATIASHAALFERGVIDAGDHTLETNVGTLTITVAEDGTVWMTQNQPEIRRVDVDYETVADALGADVAALRDVGADLPLARSSTGLPFLVVPVNFLEQLGDLAPDMTAVRQLSRDLDVAGVYAFTFDTLAADSTVHGRMFAPEAGVSEDPVTGTASGAAGAYLREFEAFESSETQGVSERPTGEGSDPGGMPEEMVFEQGHFVDRPGHVRVRVGADVSVGGRAVTTLDGTLVVPDPEDDDILEA